MIRRITERAAAGALIILFAPLFVVVSLLIIMLSRNGPLVAHRRVGQHGADVWIFKFRTMWNGAENGRPWQWIEYISDENGPMQKCSKDCRVTSRFARFCRRYSLDELPQLAHVAAGTMSLVGPRPITRRELQAYYGPATDEVLRVKPGITGLWQVRGRNRLTYKQRRQYDLLLVRRGSLRLYLMILWRTAPRVLTGKDAW
jgi:exopolysaccharide production protein ExoY